MGLRIYVDHTTNIPWPTDFLGILRAGQHKRALRHPACGLAEHLLNLWLAVRRVGSHVAEVAGKFFPGGSEAVLFRIERAIQWNSSLRSKVTLQLPQNGTAGKAEIHVEACDMF